jgi:hypothetical protein
VESNSEERIKRKAKRLGESEEKQGMEAVWKIFRFKCTQGADRKVQGVIWGQATWDTMLKRRVVTVFTWIEAWGRIRVWARISKSLRAGTKQIVMRVVANGAWADLRYK